MTSRPLVIALTGAGGLLIWAGVSGRDPRKVIQAVIAGQRPGTVSSVKGAGLASITAASGDTETVVAAGPPSPITGAAPTAAGGCNNSPSNPPALVDVPGHPGEKLTPAAAASIAAIESRGIKVPIGRGGSTRSYAAQAAYYASDSKRYARPQCSAHVTGVAIDIAGGTTAPDVAAALTAAGWNRARADEPWHWSFGVTR